MQRIVFPLNLQMQGPTVAALQAALTLLGAPIDDGEKTAQRYGTSTQQAVRQFQTARQLPVTDSVDEATASVLNTILAERGVLDDEGDGDPPPPVEPTLYSIEGEVVQPDGTPLLNYPVRAFDRALGEWRPLGSAKTNDLGRYRITYDAAQLKAWGKSRADLKLDVFDLSNAVLLASSPLILQALSAETVNFAIGQEQYRGPAEYTRVETALAPHLPSPNILSHLEVPDVLILAREAKQVNSNVASYIKAQRWATEFAASAALFYGLLRRNQPTRLDALLARPLSRLWAALTEAKAQNIVNLPLTDALHTQLSAIQQAYLTRSGHPYTQLLNTTALNPAQQALFTQRLTTSALTGEAFWQSLAPGADDNSNNDFSAEQVTDLRQTFALQDFTDNNTSLTIHLRNAHQVRTPREVAAFSVETWEHTVLTAADVEIPAEVLPGAAEPAQRAAYAQMLYRSAERRYPTASLAGQMARNPDWAGNPMPALSAFFTTYPDFEFGDERILQAHPDAQGDLADLLGVEQLFHLTPPADKLATMQPLWQAKLRSAPQIAVRGRQKLLRLAGGLDRNVATRIYRQAVHITAVALHVYTRYHPRLNSLSPYAVRLPQLTPEQTLARAATTLPEWAELFGSPDACECLHCQSALSPAAYLVDTMDFLQRAVAADDPDKSALDELLDRRPDLGTLWLTCENTEIEMPHIDLQTQIMEAIVASPNHQTLSPFAILRTTWESEQQAAQPEHLDPRAYDILRADAVYPFHLPFDLWLEEGRRYLKQMGIARHELMQVMPPKPDVGPLEMATEALQMSTHEREIIRQPNTLLHDLEEFWGVDGANGTLRQQLSQVATLMQQAKIDYNTVLRLLNTRYVNAERWVVVTFTGDSCALDGAELQRANGIEFTADEFQSFLDRLHRFLRLQRRLQCTEYELDTLLVALAAADFNADGFLSKLAAMQVLRDAFGLSLSELSSWWSAVLDPFIFEEELPSQYAAIFLDPMRFPNTHSGTGPDLRNGVFALKADGLDLVITATNSSLSPWLAEVDSTSTPTYLLQIDYAAYIQSATQLTSADLLLLVVELLPKDAATGHVRLDLANVSLLYRVASFTQAMAISMTDYLRLLKLTGIEPLTMIDLLTMTVKRASPVDSLALKTSFDEIDDGQWSLEELAYLLVHEAAAVAVLAPTLEEMAALQAELKVGYIGIEDTATATALEIAKANSELNAALTQSLGATLSLDATLLDDLLFHVRTNLGDELLTNLIAAAHTRDDQVPPPIQPIFERLYKFSLAWNGLALDPTHLAFVLNEGRTLGWTDIATLPLVEPAATKFEAWRRLSAAAELQVSLFTVEQSLFDLLQAARAVPIPPATFDVATFLVQVSDWSGWNLADLQYLVGPSGFNLNLPDAMQDEQLFVALRQAFDLFQRSGVSAEQAHAWTGAELTFAETQSIKQALTLAYDPASWLSVLAVIQDELRPLRRDALLGYLLHAKGFKDSNEFYHYYLLDPEQAECTRTSRMVEALAAVQTFAQRILLNLEPLRSAAEERKPFVFSAEDAEAWQWRKNYRVWEAARKIFLYPENWLEPEFRDNKSVFFKELEDGLAQDDINLITAERLYREYLDKLDQVSRLEIMGMYEDTWTVSGDMTTNVLHVFGRTRDIPQLFYYRRWEDQARWSPWEPVPLDIQGDHLTPIVFNGRLYLFWPNFKLTPIEPDVAKFDEEIADLREEIQSYRDSIGTLEAIKGSLPDPNGINKDQINALQAAIDDTTKLMGNAKVQKDTKITDKNAFIEDTAANEVEIGMAWSTYASGRWSPKQLASSVPAPIETDFRPKDFYFTGWISIDNRLYLAVRANGIVESIDFLSDTGIDLENMPVARFAGIPLSTDVEMLDVGFFTFDDCQSKLMFVVSNDLSGPFTPLEFPATLRGARLLGGPLEVTILTVPTGTVSVVDSQQSFDARKLNGAQLSLEIGADEPTDIRLLLGAINTDNAKVHYAHQFGLAGDELSSFFYTDNQRSYFVQPLPVVNVPSKDDVLIEASQRSVVGAAQTLPLTEQMGPITVTHYQGTNDGQIIDRGFTQMSTGAVTTRSTWVDGLGIILAEDKPPIVVTEPTKATDFRYQFTRFYHPYTCLFLKQLGRYGVEGLLNPVRDLDNDAENLYRQGTLLESFNFSETYDPNLDWVIDNSTAENLDEKIDFDHNSPYGSYNWELFFHIPLLIATRLMQNQRFAEARRWFHYIFDPTCSDGEGPERFWKIKPFYEAQLGGPTETIQELIDLLEQGDLPFDQQVEEWERNPFQPHAIARLRITAYMQTTVRKYLDCLIGEADMLFMRETREFINEATQLYLLAAEILGQRPTLLPAQEAELLTPNKLLERGLIPSTGGLFNPLERLTSLLPTFSSGVPSSRTNLTVPVLSGSALSAQGGTDSFNTLFYFCIPHNDRLYGYWDTVADRLFKIRHCMNMAGQVRQLALFAPPIDPALLVRASAAGLDIGAIISGLYAPLPNYRFNFMLAKALELCGEVRSLGGALLATLEKKDGEELSLLRSTHEVSLLASIRALKQKNVEEADASLAGLLKSKESAEFRVEYYSGLERVSSGEQKSLDKQQGSMHWQAAAQSIEVLAAGLATIPTQTSTGPQLGGLHFVSASEAIAGSLRAVSSVFIHEANKASTMASYDRRKDDWEFQADLAKKEIAQLDKQILAADIRKQIAAADLKNHEQQIAQSEEVEEFLKLKFTNQDLYNWMLSKLSSLYFQIYQMAYQIAKQAEKTYQHELGPEESDTYFFNIPYWDSLKKGLLAGELLHYDLRRMEKAYLDANQRELEITKPISLFQLDPAALLTLRETGACDIHIPEVLFDMDFAGHYFRRIKAVRLTIPCVSGPYTNVSATLRLDQSWIRREIPATDQPLPDLTVSEGTILPQIAIATSTGNQDGGMFELNFNDPRYLPFEGAGAISTWHLELPQALHPFNYDTIADVVIHLSYCARDGGTSFKQAVNGQLTTALNDWKKLLTQGVKLARLFSLRQDFATDWNRFLATEQPQALTLQLSKQHFPKYLDYLWEDKDKDGKPDSQKPIKLSISSDIPSVRVYLDPQGQLPSVATLQLNNSPAPTPAIDSDTGLTVFDFAFTGEITNESGVTLTLTVSTGELRAVDWKDVYVLVNYEVKT